MKSLEQDLSLTAMQDYPIAAVLPLGYVESKWATLPYGAHNFTAKAGRRRATSIGAMSAYGIQPERAPDLSWTHKLTPLLSTKSDLSNFQQQQGNAQRYIED